MTWFKVDDSFYSHPKVLAMQAHKGWKGAVALWSLAGSWSSDHLTDGFIPTAAVARLGCSEADAKVLVTHGLWIVAEGGFQFHDWLARNPSKKDVETKREKTRNKVQEWRRNRVTDVVTDEVRNQVSNPAPVPSRPVKREEEKNAPGGALLKASPARKPDEAMAALQAALKASFLATGDVAPDVTGKPAVGAAKRLREFVRLGHAPDLSSAATRLVEACRPLPASRWPWCLSSEPLGRVNGSNSSITADGRTKHAW